MKLEHEAEFTLIIPCYNEVEVLPLLERRLSTCLANLGLKWEVIFVDDGSKDSTYDLLASLHAKDPRYKAILLSRNFGHQAALSAGLACAQGQFVGIADADLQDPPELFSTCLEKLKQGYDVAFAVRKQRKENLLKRAAYLIFYRLLYFVSEIEIPFDSGDFCLMRRPVVDALRNMPERNVFLRGMRAWTGFRQIGIEYERAARAAGETKYPLGKLLRLASDGIFAFSTLPLRLATLLGLAGLVLSTVAGVFIVAWRLCGFRFMGHTAAELPGWSCRYLCCSFSRRHPVHHSRLNGRICWPYLRRGETATALDCSRELGSRYARSIVSTVIHSMIRTVTEGTADEGMPESMLTETLDKVRRHPWWKARAELALAVLRRHGIVPPCKIVDVGCGWGVTLDALEKAGYTPIGLDISRKILERIDRADRVLLQADLRQELSDLKLEADALLLLDVIEHVDNDQQVVHHCSQLLRPGALAIISVPARPDLFSEFDEIQGHRRRYLPDRLHSAFTNTGLKVREIFWWGQWMVPLLRRRRKSSSYGHTISTKTYSDYLQLPPWPGALLMRALYRWEQRRALDGKLHTGTSLFAIASRQLHHELTT